MTRKTIGQNTGKSGRVSLSGTKIGKFDSTVDDARKVDIAESKAIARAISDNADHDVFVSVSKPVAAPEVKNEY
jgi:hypothetical protein